MDFDEFKEWLEDHWKVAVSVLSGVLILIVLVFWFSGCQGKKVVVERGIVELATESVESVEGVVVVPLLEIPIKAYSESIRDGSQVNSVSGREARSEMEAVFQEVSNQGAR